VNFEQLLLFSIIGYLIDIGLNLVMVKFILKSDASVGSIAFFEWLHDSVTFASGFLLGLSIISISILHVGLDSDPWPECLTERFLFEPHVHWAKRSLK